MCACVEMLHLLLSVDQLNMLSQTLSLGWWKIPYQSILGFTHLMKFHKKRWEFLFCFLVCVFSFVFVFYFYFLQYQTMEQERGAYQWSVHTGYYRGTKCFLITVQARTPGSRVK